MRHFKFALLAALLIASSVSTVRAQNSESPYASENCKKGCVFGHSRHSVLTVYSGAQPKSYRICATDPFVKLYVDDRQIPIQGGSCSDVNGREIKLTGGEIVFGLLPG